MQLKEAHATVTEWLNLVGMVIAGQQKDESITQLHAVLTCLETLHPVFIRNAIAEEVCLSYSKMQ